MNIFSCSETTTNTGSENENQTEIAKATTVFPHKLPEEKPDFPMSAATERMFSYPAPRAQDNDLYTLFKYTRLKGFDYNNGDGTITRRDPSRPIYVDGKYYIWYTKRDTKFVPIGAKRAKEATDEIPSTDWDLSDIWYATSADGITWEEQGVAVSRPAKPNQGWRSVATPDILVWEGKYYLYYQAFNEPSGLRGDWCPISMSYADSPNGPWKAGGNEMIPLGKKGEWDQDQTQDPHPIVYKGKIYMYYKAAYNKWVDKWNTYAVGHGVAIADSPFGPFKKHPLNPVMQSGHETTYFPYKEGVATLVLKDGNERETIQYAKDGVNFEVASSVSLPPIAAAPFVPDAFTNTKYGKGITWGMCHFTNAGTPKQRYSILARFDCDLSLDYDEPFFKTTHLFHSPDVYFKQGVGKHRIKQNPQPEIQ
ncbi:glycoside hydrolase [Limibacter armeniacum]|uniref:glycoside hydrolase family 117 protein n=1 Tax=Limibacter armeniacum TaxID=466084 RepID=UPI002FE51606